MSLATCKQVAYALVSALDVLSVTIVSSIMLCWAFCINIILVLGVQIVNIIRAHPDHEVIIGVDTLGKEDLLLHISRALQTKVLRVFSLHTQRSTSLHKLAQYHC
jgi:hypothetical protein